MTKCTLNVKNDRFAEYEKISTQVVGPLTVEKNTRPTLNRQIISLANLVGLVSFFGILKFQGVMGSVMYNFDPRVSRGFYT